jgi:hypothetical protein
VLGPTLFVAISIAGAPAVPVSQPVAPVPGPSTVDAPTVALGEAIVVRPGATCLEHPRLVAQIRAWTDRDAIDARLVVEVTGDTAKPNKLAFTLRRGDDVVAVRRFDPAPSRCSDLHSVVGLAIALAIDATLLEEIHADPPEVLPPGADPPDDDPPDPVPADEDPPDDEPDPPAAVVDPAPPRKPDPPVLPAPRSRWRAWTEIVGVFSIGAPPGVGGGGRLTVLARRNEVLDIGGGAMLLSSGSERVGIGRALLWAAAGRVDVCVGPRFGRVRLRGCGGLVAGAAFAVGQGFDVDGSQRLPWVAVPLGAKVELRVAPRLGVVFGAEGHISALRPTFVAVDIADRQTARSFARFTGALMAGIVLGMW